MRALSVIVFVIFLAQSRAFCEEVAWGSEAEGFQIGLTFSVTNVQRGGPIIATVIDRNTTDKDRGLLTHNSPSREYTFSIIRNSKEVIPPLDQIWVSSILGKWVGAHGSITNQVRINSWFDLTRPGTYIVNVSRMVAPASVSEHEIPMAAASTVQIQSGRAVIRIDDGLGADRNPPAETTQPPAQTSAGAKPLTAGPLSKNMGTGLSVSPIPTSGQVAERNPFSLPQKIAAACAVGLLALLLFAILRRAPRRKKT